MDSKKNTHAEILKRLKLMSELYHFVYEVKKAQLKSKFPGLLPEELHRRVLEAMKPVGQP